MLKELIDGAASTDAQGIAGGFSEYVKFSVPSVKGADMSKYLWSPLDVRDSVAPLSLWNICAKSARDADGPWIPPPSQRTQPAHASNPCCIHRFPLPSRRTGTCFAGAFDTGGHPTCGRASKSTLTTSGKGTTMAPRCDGCCCC